MQRMNPIYDFHFFLTFYSAKEYVRRFKHVRKGEERVGQKFNERTQLSPCVESMYFYLDQCKYKMSG